MNFLIRDREIALRNKNNELDTTVRTCLPGHAFNMSWTPGQVWTASGQVLDSWTATGQVLDKYIQLLHKKHTAFTQKNFYTKKVFLCNNTASRDTISITDHGKVKINPSVPEGP